MQSRVGWTLVVLIAGVLQGLAGWFVWSGTTLPGGERLVGAQSAGQVSDVAQSVGVVMAQSGAETVMSGAYEVGADGKLLHPKDAPVPFAPVPPDVMRHDTPEGMEAFAHYIMALVPYIRMTGDTSQLEAVSLPQCQWCAQMVELTKKRHSDSGWIQDVEMRVLSVSVPFEIEGHPHLWHIELEYLRTATTSYDGERLEERPEERAQILLQAKHDGGKRFLSELDEL